MTSDAWPAGVPCWTDLMVPDPDAVRPFYDAVLGWTLTEPDEQFGGYVMALKDGAPAAGVGPLREGSRSAWTMYFAVDDADAVAAATRAAGGTVFADPMDVGDLGRMFVGADPTGAVFGVWQAGSFSGAAVTNQPGGLMWEDLRCTDPGSARQFYAAVFGFDYHEMDMETPQDYMVFTLPGTDRPLGGMGGLDPNAESVASHWSVTFAVADADASVAAATTNGGAVPIPPFDSPYGRMAGLTDPAGAPFWIIQPARQT
ncbi:MAG: VOC family protein [Candidatus Nanopelagicales bacterium]